MVLDIPSTSQDEVLQNRFNRQVDEVISGQAERIDELEKKLDYIKAIPSDITTVSEIVTYLQGV